MADKAKFAVEKREIVGKRVKHLRKAGVVPGTVYGADCEAQNIQVEDIKIERLINEVGFNAPLYLEIEGKKTLAIIKKVDREATTGHLRSVDFQAVSAKDPIDAEIEIVLTGKGESKAEKAGLMVMQVLDTVEVRALPNDMIQEVEVSIMDLENKGDKLALADIKLPKGVEFTNKKLDMEQAIANVVDPADIEAANEAAGGDATDESEVKAENGSEEAETEESKEEK